MSDNSKAIADLLLRARDLVANLQLNPHLEAIAYSKAIELLQTGSTVGPSQAVAGELPGRALARSTTERLDERIAMIARALQVDADVLEAVYSIAADRVDVVVSRSRLPKERFPAMRTVSILLAAARQALDLDDGWTSVDLLRDACRDFGVLDSNNFAAAVSSLGDNFVVRGKGAGREVKVTKAGFEETGRLILQLIAGAR
jgi:hypothetical protein